MSQLVHIHSKVCRRTFLHIYDRSGFNQYDSDSVRTHTYVCTYGVHLRDIQPEEPQGQGSRRKQEERLDFFVSGSETSDLSKAGFDAVALFTYSLVGGVNFHPDRGPMIRERYRKKKKKINC